MPLFEKRKDYDAEIQEYPPDLDFNNFPWSKAKLHMERMAVNFFCEEKSFIAVCNDNLNDRDYYKMWFEAFAEEHSLPIMAFGGYAAKLNQGVKIVYLLQPEWIDYLEHLQ